MTTTTAQVPRADVGDADWTEPLARAGLVARGVVFTTFGAIAVRLAVAGDTGGEEASTAGAFGELVEKPFGKALVALVALGLVAWAASCLVAAASGRNGSTPGPSDAGDRARDVVRGAVGLALAGAATQVLLRGDRRGGDGRERALTARLMDAPAGQLLVGAIGLTVLGVGLYHLVKAARRDFRERVHLPPPARRPLEALGLVGHVGRGLVFALVGGFVVRAAATHDPDEARGIDGALRELAGGGPGRALLLLTAVGVAAFGLWTFVEARYRRPDSEG